MRDKDHLIKHGTIMLLATVFSGIFNYGYHILMVRMLGPEDYGILFSLVALFMIISLPAGTIQTIIAKYISAFRAQNQLGKISYILFRSLKKVSVYCGILLVIYLLCSRLLADYLKIPTIIPVIIVGPILFFGILFPIGFGAFQGLERFTQIGCIQVLSAFLRISLAFLLVFLGLGVNGALLGSLLAAFAMIGLAFWALRNVWGFKPYDKDIGKSEIYKYFVPVSIAYVCFGFITYIDAIIVKHYFIPLEAGYYSTVSMLGKAFLFPPMAFAGAMFPKVSAKYELGRHTGHLLKKTILYSSVVAIVGIILCISFPHLIVRIVMKPEDITPCAMATIIPLLRLVGFAVTPYGLTCIIINYHLARHQYSFLVLFILGALLQITFLSLFHQSLIQVLIILLIAGVFILISGFIQPRFLIDKMARRR